MPQSAPALVGLLAGLTAADFQKILSLPPEIHAPYLHWDDLRHREPPAGLDRREWWTATKLARAMQYKPLPLPSADGRVFRYVRTDAMLEMLSDIDARARGGIGAPRSLTNPVTGPRYLISSLIEEGIASSQLEGATSTRKVAKDMLRSGRAPRDRSERMILNNYRAMKELQDLREAPVDPAALLHMQSVLTEGTAADSTYVGRFRQDRDDIAVYELGTDQVLHIPPPASEVSSRLQRLCDFVNDRIPDQPYMHPVVRAIIAHLGLAYVHPFCDGNGRTARALFYWSMLSEGYWLCEFISISRILKRAPSKYSRSFLLTETDDDDATYFILSQLEVIRRALDALYTYVEQKAEELRETQRLLRSISHLNHRQLALVGHALRNPDAVYTFKSHQNSHRVVYQTARTDLLRLERLGALEKKLEGRQLVFRPVDDLDRRLRTME